MDSGGSGVGETVTCCNCGKTVDVDYTRNARVVLTAVQREAGPVVRLQGDHTDGVAVWEHAGLGAIDGYMLYLCEGTKAHIEDVVCKLLEAARGCKTCVGNPRWTRGHASTMNHSLSTWR